MYCTVQCEYYFCLWYLYYSFYLLVSPCSFRVTSRQFVWSTNVVHTPTCVATLWRVSSCIKAGRWIKRADLKGKRLISWETALHHSQVAWCRRGSEDTFVFSEMLVEMLKKKWRVLKEPLAIETRAFSRIGSGLITAKTQVEIYFLQYLNYN